MYLSCLSVLLTARLFFSLLTPFAVAQITRDRSCFTDLVFPTSVPGENDGKQICKEATDANGDPVYTVGFEEFEDISTLESIIIEPSTITISNFAFRNNGRVGKINLLPVGPNDYNGVLNIKQGAFQGSTAGVKNIDFPLQVREVGASAFGGVTGDEQVSCGIESVVFTSWNLDFKGDPFTGCDKLEPPTRDEANVFGIFFDMNTVTTIAGASSPAAANLECLSDFSYPESPKSPPLFQSDTNGPYSCSTCAACRCKAGAGVHQRMVSKSNQKVAPSEQVVFSCVSCNPGEYSVENSTFQNTLEDFDQFKAEGKLTEAYGLLLDPGTRASYFRSRICVPCEPGSWSNIHSPTCTLCKKGTASEISGAPSERSCKRCPVGKYADTKGAEMCRKCPDGFECSDVTATPTLCAAGSYSNKTVGYKCTLCESGKFTPNKGYADCIDCPLGGDCKQEGTSMPFPCSPGMGYSDNKCVECLAGKYSEYGKECIPCNVTYMCPDTGMNTMTPCGQGYYQNKMGQTSCEPCELGKYVSIVRSKECQDCPPGSKCPGSGMSMPTKCDIGQYSPRKGMIKCTDCQRGKWQNSTGNAVCEDCKAGSHNNLPGETSINACRECSPGNYSSQAGQALCVLCPDGYYQALSGQTACIPCKDGFTNNKDRTDCTPEPKEGALSGMSVTEIMIEEGFALWIAFVVTAGFMGTAAFMTYFREKDPEHLANFSRFEALYNSFFAGFSAGAELLLAITLVSIPNEAGGVYGLASAMFLARLIHFAGAVVILTALFGPRDRVASLEFLFSGACALIDDLDLTFAKENVYIVESIALLCLFDVTMLQFMPWKKSDFYRMSEGFPNMAVLRSCLSIKSVQSVITVTCEIIYLYTYEDSDKDYTQALLIMNIVVGVATVIIEIMMLCLRGNLLEETENGKVMRSAQAAADGLELQNVYANGGPPDVAGTAPGQDGFTNNPLHPSNATPYVGAAGVGAGAGLAASAGAAEEGQEEGEAGATDVATLHQLLQDKDVELRKSMKQLKKREKEISKLKRASGIETDGVRDSMVSVQSYASEI